MISKEDISILSNYIETKQPRSVITYIDESESGDEEYKRQMIVKNRNFAIDAIIEDKVEEYDNFLENKTESLDHLDQYYPTVEFKLSSISVHSNTKLVSYEDLWNSIIDYIESNTQGQHSYLLKNKIGPTLKKDLSKITHKILMLSNMISILSRKGPANLVIAGTDASSHLRNNLQVLEKSNNKNLIGSINGMKIIRSNRVSPNKVIICRIEGDPHGGGLTVINDIVGGKYCITETNMTFYKKFVWFDIN